MVPFSVADGILTFDTGEGEEYAVALNKIAEGLGRDSTLSFHAHHAMVSSIKSCPEL